MNIEEMARQAGINTKFWNMGAGSVLFVSFVDGIPRSNFEHFTELVKAEVLEQAAQKAENFGPDRPIVHSNPSQIVKGRWEGEQAASKNIAEAIRAMKPTREG